MRLTSPGASGCGCLGTIRYGVRSGCLSRNTASQNHTMELRNARAYVSVAHEGHFGRAAVSLNITQPALTQGIQVLERELGIQLLTRSSREVRLTAAGEALREHANMLVQEEGRALREMKDHVAGIAGRIRMSYLTVWNLGLPANIVAEFRRRYPAVLLETTSGYSKPNVARVMTVWRGFEVLRLCCF